MLNREEEMYSTTAEIPPPFFSGSEASMVYTFPDLWCIPFFLFSKDMVYTMGFFCSVTLGSGDRPRGGATVVVYTPFFPGQGGTISTHHGLGTGSEGLPENKSLRYVSLSCESSSSVVL